MVGLEGNVCFKALLVTEQFQQLHAKPMRVVSSSSGPRGFDPFT